MSMPSRSSEAMCLLAAVLLAGGGCAAPINTGSMWAPNTVGTPPIGPSFQWAAFTGTPPASPEAQQIRQMVHEAVENQLMSQGYRESTTDQSDFWVVARMSRSQQGDATAAVPFEEYTQGSLHVYVVDPRTRQWLWRAWADARLEPSSPPEEKRKRLAEAVRMMFKSFPSIGRQGSNPQP